MNQAPPNCIFQVDTADGMWGLEDYGRYQLIHVSSEVPAEKAEGFVRSIKERLTPDGRLDMVLSMPRISFAKDSPNQYEGALEALLRETINDEAVDPHQLRQWLEDEDFDVEIEVIKLSLDGIFKYREIFFDYLVGFVLLPLHLSGMEDNDIECYLAGARRDLYDDTKHRVHSM